MAIKPASAKAKGRRLQQWVMKRLGELTGLPYGPEDEDLIRSRPMGQRGVDVVLVGEAAEQLPYSIECKNGESFQLVKTVEQAKANIKPGTDWIIVHRRQAWREPIVIMGWGAWEKAIQARIENMQK